MQVQRAYLRQRIRSLYIYFNFQSMTEINKQKLAELVNKSLSLANLQSVFTKFNQQYQDSFTFEHPTNIITAASKINDRAAKDSNRLPPQPPLRPPIHSFHHRQLKIFSWVVVVYCELQSQTIQEIDDFGIELIHSIFPNKPPLFIRFTILHFKPKKTKNKKNTWNAEEEELLVKVVGKQTERNWKEVSFEIYCLSEGLYFRHHQECRQKWNNYLDPEVNRGKWTDQQDLNLLIEAEAIDCNWSLVSQGFKFFRTQHMIKNRYRSLLNHYKKKFAQKSDKKVISKAIKDLKQKVKAQSEEKAIKKAAAKISNHNVNQLIKEEQVHLSALESLENSELDAMVDEKQQRHEPAGSKTEEIQMILVERDRLDSWIPNQFAYEMGINQNLLEKISDLAIEDEDKQNQRRTNDEDDDLNQWIFEFEEREDKRQEWFLDDEDF